MNPIKVLIVGKCGIGKSSLINCFLGEDKAPINDDETGTTIVNKYQIEHILNINSCEAQQYTFEIFDTPGVGDVRDNKISYKGLKNVNFDLVLICHNINQSRLFKEDIEQINNLNRLYKNKMFVMLQCNMISDEQLQNRLNIRMPKMGINEYYLAYKKDYNDNWINNLLVEIVKHTIKNIKIMVVGSCGTGKSSLINFLLDEDLAPKDDNKICTTEIKSYEKICPVDINNKCCNYNFIFYDTPGTINNNLNINFDIAA